MISIVVATLRRKAVTADPTSSLIPRGARCRAILTTFLVLLGMCRPAPSAARIDAGGWFSRLLSMSVDGTFYISTQGYHDQPNQGAIWAFFPHPQCVGGGEPEGTTCEVSSQCTQGGDCSVVKWVFKVD